MSIAMVDRDDPSHRFQKVKRRVQTSSLTAYLGCSARSLERNGTVLEPRSAARTHAAMPRHPPKQTSKLASRRNLMLTVGDRLPEFKLHAVVSIEKGKEFQEVTNHT